MSRSRKFAAVPLPKHVFKIKGRKGQAYYYYQRNRGQEDHGPLIRLPEYDEPEFWAKVKELNAGPVVTVKEKTVDDMIAKYKLSAEWTGLKPNSQRLYQFRLDTIALAWGKKLAADVTPAMVLQLRDHLSESPSVANQTVQIARLLFKWGVPREFASTNPAREVAMIRYDEEGAEPWPEAVYAHVVQNAPKAFKHMAIIGRATGQRAGDLCKMRPADKRDGGMNLAIQKLGGKKHWVPLKASDHQAIDALEVDMMVPYITSPTGKRYTAHGLLNAWKAWLSTEAGKPAVGCTIHDLRAMAVCDRRMDGMTHQEIANDIGMSIGMVSRYSKKIDQKLLGEATIEKRERAENERLKSKTTEIENQSAK